jgi:hypothetical protein
MPPSYAVPDPVGQRTWPTSDRYIKFADAPQPFVYIAQRPEPRWTTLSRGDLYASLLQADSYLEAARDQLRAGDEDAVRHAIAVLRAIVEVVTGQLRGSSSENVGTLQ